MTKHIDKGTPFRKLVLVRTFAREVDGAGKMNVKHSVNARGTGHGKRAAVR